MEDDRQVRLDIDGDHLLVTQPALLTDRRARMMFSSVLGASPTSDGWRCPRRRFTTEELTVRINSFLEKEGWSVLLAGPAGTAVERAAEQEKSFQRTHRSAEEFRLGRGSVDLTRVRAMLKDCGWDDAQRRLLDHQEHGLIHGLTAINAANFSVPGSGKTATTLAVAAVHLQANTIDLLIVVGPLSCFEPWETEAAVALPGVVTPIRVRGNRRQRHEIYKSVHARQILLLSYATAAADRSGLTTICDSFKAMLVVDESHRIKRFKGGVWAPALKEIAKHARVRIILSGTPMPHSGRDLYSQLNVLWPSAELTGPRDTFAVEVERNFGHVLRRIRPFLTRTPKEALGLQPYQVVYHEVTLRDTQKEVYDLITTGLRRRIEQAELWVDKLESLRRARPIRLLQAATNPNTLNSADTHYRLPRLESPNPTLMERLASYANRETPAKFETALNIVSAIMGNEGKVVCWSNFISNLDQFTKYVKDKLPVPVFQIDGRIPIGDESEYDDSNANTERSQRPDTRESIIARFLNTVGPAVLVANPASCSESISLHRGCHNAIYLDRTYDSAMFLQSVDRIHRLGLPPDAAISIHIIRATLEDMPTIDHLVESSLRRKEDRMKHLLEGAELAPLEQGIDPSIEAEGDKEDLGELLHYLLGEEAFTE